MIDNFVKFYIVANNMLTAFLFTCTRSWLVHFAVHNTDELNWSSVSRLSHSHLSSSLLFRSHFTMFNLVLVISVFYLLLIFYKFHCRSLPDGRYWLDCMESSNITSVLHLCNLALSERLFSSISDSFFNRLFLVCTSIFVSIQCSLC